ncbi:PREDICTED: centromere protein K, partial [Mesitornis unicolor]|uniref:centromere protein K n=1 Tax=Mesitornis unicolor TaxID=54374 RepID=UPI00052852BB
ISANPDVLLALGKEELKKVKNDLEMVLSRLKLKNEQLEEDLRREQQWYEQQEQLLDTFNRIEEEMKHQGQEHSRKSLNIRVFNELQQQKLELDVYKEKILNDLGEFLEEYFPFPNEHESSKMKNSGKPDVRLGTVHETLEILINKLISTPHEPYVEITDSFWPPYVELLLRYGIALRHPEDPNRIRLEAFHL